VSVLRLFAPLAGWCMPLSEVPDPVFADKLAGDGVAIDPTGNMLHAPCDGEIVPMQGASHAVTVRSEAGIDILMHVGIDTVQLAGEGFELLVAPGQRVRAGDPLLRFDLDLLARRARSLITPIVLASEGTIATRLENRCVAVGELLMEIDVAEAVSAHPGRDETQPGRDEARRGFRVPFDHGLHVRPAALIAAALRPFGAQITIAARGRNANARSTVAMMALGVRCGDTIEVRAVGADARSALEALGALLVAEIPAAQIPAAARTEVPSPAGALARSQRIEGVIASRGVAVGVAVRWSEPELAVAERGASEPSETAALRNAVAFVRHHLAERAAASEGQAAELLCAHCELVDDPELAERASQWLKRGFSAAYAWRRATRSMMETLESLEDKRMRERAADLRDLESQVIRVLAGELPAIGRELPLNAIVLADDLMPSQLLGLDATRVAGLVLARGGATSHVAIIAAANAIATLVAAGPAILEVAEGTPLVLDAEHGWIDIDPPAAELAAATRAAVQRAEERAADLAVARHPSSTLDGVRVVVNANVGSLDEARAAVRNGAEGCGLLRTEFLFLERREAPGEDEQAAEYQGIVLALEGRPATIRTLDAGGDKPIAYLPMPREDNPALGLRGVRASLRHPDLLKTQLRAMLRITPHGLCRIMLPMVNDLEDLRAVRALAAECARELGRPALPAIGVMVETPAAALLSGQLAGEADFLSIGTNDLSQYTLAIDRGHPELAERLDALHPAVLRMIATVAQAGRAAGKSVSVCGAMGSDVDALPILIGLGVHEISATPAMVPRLKRTVRLLDAAQCRELALRALEQHGAAAVRELAQAARARARAGAQSIEEA
jgi:phosphoenolpyruvate-protein phosphotransferase